MNTKNLLLILVMLCFAAGLASCGQGGADEDYPYEQVEEGGNFLRANTLRLYYIDGQGRGLINPDDLTSLPISYNDWTDKTLPDTIPAPLDFDGGSYNANHNFIIYDEALKLYYLQTNTYGDMSRPDYTFYIWFDGAFDTMNLRYRYTDKNVFGGKYHAKIISWQFNGTHIYSDDEGMDKKVFIKKSDGKTIISFNK